MTAKELKKIFQKGECLSLDTMRLYNDGKLNKKSMHEVEKHLLECGLCSAAVDGLNARRITEINKLSSHIQRRLAVYMNTPPRLPFLQRFGLLLIAGFILLSGGITWWFLSENHKKEQPELTDTSRFERKNPQSEQDTLGTTSYPAGQPQNTNSNPGQPLAHVEDHAAGTTDKTNASPEQTSSPVNVLPVSQEIPLHPASENKTPEQFSGSGPTSRNAENTQPVRIKSVQIYPAVSHSEKPSRHEEKSGQLGRTSSSDANFKLDEMPSFPGGDEALRNYILSNFKPTAADRSKLTRYATGVMFVVNSKTGSISSPELSFSISSDIDKELLRVISSMPNWYPGKKRGEVDIMIGITFE